MSPLASVAKKIACSSWSSQAWSNFRTRGGKCSCNSMASVIMLWAHCEEEALLISWTHQHRAGRPRPHGARREISSRAGALLCVLALLVQLALAVEHTWEVSREATAASAVLASQLSSTGPGDTRAIFKAVTVQRRAPHDPLLCSVCQLLSQAKIGIALAWSRGFPSPNQLDVSAGCRLPWLWH